MFDCQRKSVYNLNTNFKLLFNIIQEYLQETKQLEIMKIENFRSLFVSCLTGFSFLFVGVI